MGLPVFTFVFFLPYWFILCPFLWRKYPAVGINNRAWNSPWLYGYWLTAAGVWISVYIADKYCCKREKNLEDDEDSLRSTEKLLLPSQSFKTSTPFRVTPLAVQPKREESEIPGSIEQHIRGIDITYAYVQPKSSLKTMPPSRPSENEFTWDNEDIPWSSGEGESVDSFYSLDVSTSNFDFTINNTIEEEKSVETAAEDLYPAELESTDDITLCAGISSNSEEETLIESTLLGAAVALKEKENLDELTAGMPVQINSTPITLPSGADAVDPTSNEDHSSLENDSCVKRRFKDREDRPCWNAADTRNSLIKRNLTPSSDARRKSKRLTFS